MWVTTKKADDQKVILNFKIKDDQGQMSFLKKLVIWWIEFVDLEKNEQVRILLLWYQKQTH